MTPSTPLVGLLYNPAVPLVLDVLGARVDFVEVIPDRLWYDFGTESGRHRFSHSTAVIDELKRYASDRAVIGHGIGLRYRATYLSTKRCSTRSWGRIATSTTHGTANTSAGSSCV